MNENPETQTQHTPSFNNFGFCTPLSTKRWTRDGWKIYDGGKVLLGVSYCQAFHTLAVAAPDLVEALWDCLAIIEDELANDPEPDDLTSWHRTIAQAQAALAKATT